MSTSAILDRLARQVQESRQPVPLTRDDEVIAVVQPAPKRAAKKRAPSQHKPIPRTDSIFQIIGLGSSEGPNDVSANVDKYLADAYYHSAQE